MNYEYSHYKVLQTLQQLDFMSGSSVHSTGIDNLLTCQLSITYSCLMHTSCCLLLCVQCTGLCCKQQRKHTNIQLTSLMCSEDPQSTSVPLALRQVQPWPPAVQQRHASLLRCACPRPYLLQRCICECTPKATHTSCRKYRITCFNIKQDG